MSGDLESETLRTPGLVKLREFPSIAGALFHSRRVAASFDFFIRQERVRGDYTYAVKACLFIRAIVAHFPSFKYLFVIGPLFLTNNPSI